MLLDAGIDVLTTMNVQHLESLNDQVWHVTGVRVRETVPDWVVDDADEVVFVDLTPRALRNRLERGVVYGQEKARSAMENFFTEANLTALREMAIRHTAHEVEEKLATAPGRRSRTPGKAPRPALASRSQRADSHLPDWPPVFRHSDSPRQTRRRLSPGRLPCHPRRRRRPKPRSRRTPFELRPQSPYRNPHNRSRRCRGGAYRVCPLPKHNSDLYGPLQPQPWWKLHSETIVQRVVRDARDMQITIVAERRR